MITDKLKELATGPQPQTLQELFQGSKEGMMADRVTQNVRGAMGEMKGQMTSEMLAQMEQMISQAVHEAISLIRIPRDGRDGVGRDGKDGKNGKDAEVDYQKIVKEVMEKIPPLVISRRGGGGGGGGDTIISEDLSSQADGSTRTFTTTKTIGKSLIVISSQFPTVLRLTTDFTASGTTLTLNSSLDPIQSGQTLYFLFSEG